MKSHRLCLCLALASIPAAAVAADQTTRPATVTAAPESLNVLQGRPDEAPSANLGARYESRAAGISFRTPANCVQIKRTGDEIARFANAAKHWELVATKTTTAEPISLRGSGEKFHDSGLLAIVVSQIKANNPGAEILRDDIINIGDYEAGMIAARFTIGTQRKLLQQVIVQANRQLYYTITLTTPAAKKTDESEDKPGRGGFSAPSAAAPDPGEKLAVETFGKIVDSIKLLDLAPIRADQDQRLFRTRAFYVNLTADQLKHALVPQQWLRVMKNGKDVGYMYVIEETATHGPWHGVKIGIRSRTMPDVNTQSDGETWYFMSFDRHHETWSNVRYVQDRKTGHKSHSSEIGASDMTARRVLDDNLKMGAPGDPQQPPVQKVEVYNLTVTRTGANAGDPLKQELPPFYLPQALGYLLPHVLPLDNPKTYMFYSYVSDQGKVMARYIDVGRQQTVRLNGQNVKAIPIKDRIGLDGSPMIHYMSPEGKYLGSVNSDAELEIFPSDARTLQRIWAHNANLTRPPRPEQSQPR